MYKVINHTGGLIMGLNVKYVSCKTTLLNYFTWANRLRRRITWFFLYCILLLHPKQRELLLACIRDKFRDCTTPIVISASLNSDQGKSPRDHGLIHWDGSLCITLWANDIPLVGIAVELWCNEIYIRQLQGVKGATIPKDLHRWDRIFVEGCKLFAKKGGLKAVRLTRPTELLSSKLSQYRAMSAQEKEERKEIQGRKKRRYDGTARTTGLKINKSKRWNVWYTPQD
jgi:hypothetical protein